MKRGLLFLVAALLTAGAYYHIKRGDRISQLEADLKAEEKKRVAADNDAQSARRRSKEFEKGMRDAHEDLDKLLLATKQGSRAGDKRTSDARPTFADFDQRRKVAAALADGGQYGPALEQLLYLFDDFAARAPGASGVRRTALLEQIAKLAQVHPPAMEALLSRRSAAEAAAFNSKEPGDALKDFLALNLALKDTGKSLAFYDQLPSDDARRKTVATFAFDSLIAAGRYNNEATPTVYKSMSDHIDFYATQDLQFAKRDNPTLARAQFMTALANSVAVRVEALAGVGSTEQAKQLAQKVLALDSSPSTRDILTQGAARAGKPDLLRGL